MNGFTIKTKVEYDGPERVYNFTEDIPIGLVARIADKNGGIIPFY